MDIKDCTALVTGANRGIGAAFVAALLEAGAAKVYAACRDPQAADLEFDPADPCVEALQLDVTDAQAIAAAAEACGDVQLLVNNAGYFANTTLLGAPDIDNVRQEMEVNFFGPLQLSRAFAPAPAQPPLRSRGSSLSQLRILSCCRASISWSMWEASYFT